MAPEPDHGVVWEALRRVYDPELGIDIVSLGLVYDVREENGQIVIEMTLTTPGCPVSDGLPEQVEAEVGFALGPNVIEPDVRLVWDPPWTPQRLSEDAGAALGFRPR
ncbi:MAG: metal-sulfur cluster assembly factor [Acidimicrobiaceae bacterium]|nr:metal-sulfur cluster assembly factor [Acidimicrobiaceae bacterium]